MDNQFSNKWYEDLARDLKSGAKAPAPDPAPAPFSPAVPPAPITAADEFAFDFSDAPEKDGKKSKTKTAKTTGGKKKKKSDPVTTIILALSVLIFLGSSGYLAYNFIIQPMLLKQQMANYTSNTSGSDIGSTSNGIWTGSVIKQEARNKDGTLKDFDKLRKLNPDCVGRLTIPNTPIDYPVTQTKNNSYYLNHNFDKQDNAAGCLFLDYQNVLTKKEMSRCSIIYGHHRRNGTMFGKLEYYNDLEFYKANPVFTFDTIYNRYRWVVFANFRATADSSTGKIFQYIKTDFKDDTEYTNFISAIRTRSLINTPVDVKASDDILLLSTCSYEKANWRMVIAARKVRPKETTIDVSRATMNPNPLMP